MLSLFMGKFENTIEGFAICLCCWKILIVYALGIADDIGIEGL